MTAAASSSDPRAAAPADLGDLAGLKLGNYRLERLVGRGRMGAVYLANDEALLRPTAVKILAWSVGEAPGQDPLQWFLAEARLVARINHPRVVQIYGAARHGDHCYIAMEYVAGSSAEALVARGGPMAAEAATDVLLQAASALHAAHRAGVVHRDVKPANLLVGAGGVTKLGDFGMALGVVEGRAGGAHLRVGTPYYIAPELWRGQGASAASDLYALGATYFHLLTGRPPYAAGEVAAVEQAHLRAAIPDPRELVPGLPASCAALVRRALAKAPRDRHGSAQELLWDGRRVLQDLVSASARGAIGARRGRTPGAPARAAPAPRTASPSGPLGAMGFARAPFEDTCAAAYGGEPFASVGRRVVELLEDDVTPVVALVGPPRSGRSAGARGVAAALAPSRLVLAAEASRGADGLTPLQQLCRSAGAVEHSSDDDAVDALVAALTEERGGERACPILVVDGLIAPPPAASPLATIVHAPRWTRAFKLLVVGPPGLAEAPLLGADAAGARAPEVAVPAPDREQLAAYLRAGLAAALAPGAPPVLLSVDALNLVWRASEGALDVAHRTVERMLLLAAAEGGRVLTSWHAWTAQDGARWPEPNQLAALPRRPAAWPPPEVEAVLDGCRGDAGLPPWPRAQAAGGRARAETR